MKDTTISVAILGASGYTGSELIRILLRHPFVRIAALGADRKAGEKAARIFPHFIGADLPDLQKIEEIDFTDIDCVFCALPHGLTQDTVKTLPAHVKIVDLSADFRLDNPADYQKYYGAEHRALELQSKFVYGLTEFYRDHIKTAHYVANTGCYVAASLLALLPVVTADLVNRETIIIDAKSGVTGAGKSLKEGNLFAEVQENFRSYAVNGHRHSGEINAELSKAAGAPVKPRFIPHLIPQNRGICATIYVDLKQGVTPQTLHETLSARYAAEYFIHTLPFGDIPQTAFTRGSNFVQIGVSEDPENSGRAVIVSVLDNLIKGASGQAVQNMNVMCGFPEHTALTQLPLYP